MMEENNQVKKKFLTELSLMWNNDNQNHDLKILNNEKGEQNLSFDNSEINDNLNSEDLNNLEGEMCSKDFLFPKTEVPNAISDTTTLTANSEPSSVQSNSSSSITVDENTTQLRFSPLMCNLTDSELYNEASNCVRFDNEIINHECDDSVVNKVVGFALNNDTPRLSGNDDEGIGNCEQNISNDEEKSPQTNFSEVSPISSGESSLDSGVVSLDDSEANLTKKTVLKESQQENEQIFISNPNFPSTPFEAKLLRKRRSNLSDSVWPESKRKKSISKIVSFKGVTVYYFSRKQSFVTVPSQGGSTLGMGLKHIYSKEMTINQHKRSISRRRQSVIKERKRQQQIDIKVKQLKQKYPGLEMQQLISMVTRNEPEESEESSSSDEDVNDVYGICEEEDQSTEDEYFFLQPIPTKKRRVMLRMAGVQKIDSEEKITNRLTRESREVCGCDCDGVCVPSTCQCAQQGIPCQVDRESFPCGCKVNGCHNGSGRIEFDSERVKHHYIHTMRQIRLEETGAKPLQEDLVTTPVEPRKSPYVTLKHDNTINTTQTYNICDLNTNNNSILNTSNQNGMQPTVEKHVQFSEPSSLISPNFCDPTNHWSTSYCDSLNNVYNNNNNCAQQFFPEVNNNSIGTVDAISPQQNFGSLQFSFNTQNDAKLNGNTCLKTETPQLENLAQPDLYQYLNPNFTEYKEPVSRYGATVSKVSFHSEDNSPNSSETPFKLDPIASFLPLTTAVPLTNQQTQIPFYTSGLSMPYQNTQGHQQPNDNYQTPCNFDKDSSYVNNITTENQGACNNLLSECGTDAVNVFS